MFPSKLLVSLIVGRNPLLVAIYGSDPRFKTTSSLIKVSDEWLIHDERSLFVSFTWCRFLLLCT